MACFRIWLVFSGGFAPTDSAWVIYFLRWRAASPGHLLYSLTHFAARNFDISHGIVLRAVGNRAHKEVLYLWKSDM